MAELYLFDDAVAADWSPFSLTRPAGELRHGALTLRERIERLTGTRSRGHVAAPHLHGFSEPGAPPVLDVADLPADRDVLLLCPRAVPDWGAALPVNEAATFVVDDRVCGWLVPAGAQRPDAEALARPEGRTPGRRVELGGHWLDAVWDPIVRLGRQIAADVAALHPDVVEPELPHGVHRFGDHAIVLGRDVRIEPGVVLDAREGPIVLGDRVLVRPFTRLVGPAAVDADTVLLGGPLDTVSIGPVCKVHGEVEGSILLGYSNKAHDGFLGHACLGRWVNLGALTTNSDLKNNYGGVRLQTPAGTVDTGQTKLGSLLGDHVKTAIGTLLNTGTVVGAGSNLFGPAMPPRYVPPFTWGSAPDAGAYELEPFLSTARAVMARRGLELDGGMEWQLREAWRRGRREAERERGG